MHECLVRFNAEEKQWCVTRKTQKWHEYRLAVRADVLAYIFLLYMNTHCVDLLKNDKCTAQTCNVLQYILSVPWRGWIRMSWYVRDS